jgi:hypothetical protein
VANSPVLSWWQATSQDSEVLADYLQPPSEQVRTKSLGHARVGETLRQYDNITDKGLAAFPHSR